MKRRRLIDFDLFELRTDGKIVNNKIILHFFYNDASHIQIYSVQLSYKFKTWI